MNTADSLFFAQKWQDAQIIYESLLSDTARNGMAWNRLGFCYYHENNYIAALQAYQKSLNCNAPQAVIAVVWSRMAKIHALTNEIKTAINELDSATKYRYSNFSEMDTLKDFNSLREVPAFKNLKIKVYSTAFPCMVDTQARVFDFWVGDWDVYRTGTKTLVGHNTIQIIADGCGLLENWTNLGNQTGKSINYIDPNTTKWKQAWVGGGNQEFFNGAYKDGAMRFMFETTDSKGAKQIGRFIFYNESANQVRQLNETSQDSGKTWITVYDFTYIRKQNMENKSPNVVKSRTN